MKNTVLGFYGFNTPRLYSLQPNGKNGITMCQTQNVGKMLRNRTPGGQSVPLRCAGGGLLQPEKPSSGTQNTAFRKSESRKTNHNYGFSLPQKGLCHGKKAARKAQNGHATLHTFAQNRITNDVSTRYSCTRIFNEFPPNQKTFATDAIPNVKMKCNKKGRNGIHVAFCHSRKPCRASRRGRQRPSH